jgi:hypothetical protein
MFATQDELNGWNACLKEALQHLLREHPEVKSTLVAWLSNESAALKGLDFTAPQTTVRYQMRSSAEVPTAEQKGRFAALQLLATIG